MRSDATVTVDAFLAHGVNYQKYISEKCKAWVHAAKKEVSCYLLQLLYSIERIAMKSTEQVPRNLFNTWLNRRKWFKNELDKAEEQWWASNMKKHLLHWRREWQNKKIWYAITPLRASSVWTNFRTSSHKHSQSGPCFGTNRRKLMGFTNIELSRLRVTLLLQNFGVDWRGGKQIQNNECTIPVCRCNYSNINKNQIKKQNKFIECQTGFISSTDLADRGHCFQCFVVLSLWPAPASLPAMAMAMAIN